MYIRIFRRIRRRRVLRRRAPKNQVDYEARKEQARALVILRLTHFQSEYVKLDPAHAVSMNYARVAVRNQRSRWGSCSAKKNLNFNYRILDLPQELCDYVIAHELCHLKELHHGRAFWDLLTLTIPDARELNAKTRKMRLS